MEPAISCASLEGRLGAEHVGQAVAFATGAGVKDISHSAATPSKWRAMLSCAEPEHSAHEIRPFLTVFVP
ncbi:hypothetical protein [Rhodobacter aestuarii]|uniref:hypothetical protein n=1 Tax=Rhodobacter aestuarii TaxID=453582 RepID=UPI0011B259DC|nr:hypothetical protein [Rhodobacter aestuarii]